MKIVIISDTHTRHLRICEEIPEGDVLIHCGDICNNGTDNEYFDFIEWFKSLPHKKKIFIAGNHDWALMNKSAAVEQSLADLRTSGTGTYYLQDSSLTIKTGTEDVNFYGSPWTPEFCGWAFMKSTDDMAEVWNKVPQDTHILISHGPPLTDNSMDYVPDTCEHVGCEHQAKLIKTLPNLKVNCFGHIHEGYGMTRSPENIILINASTCTLDYTPSNKPIVIEI
jgi:Icc-related predicted phosphoesterase